MAAFRILSLDGGGLLGAFSAGVLAKFEKQTGRRIVEHFDLITGTSTGGLIAIGLAMGATAEEILNFYRTKGASIFPQVGRVQGWVKTFRTLFRPKFQPDNLRAAVLSVVGDKPLCQARTRLVIPAYQASLGRVYLFKTPHGANLDYAANVPAVDVALATSAAPTYFPAHRIADKGAFIDGGVWANCPAMVGIVEAVAFCRQRLENLDLLSISTTNYPFRISKETQLGGYKGWAPRILETFMFGQIQGAVAEAQCLLGKDRFLRIDFQTEPQLYTIDDPGAVEELVELGTNEAEKIANRTAVAARFLNGETICPFSA